MGFVTEKTEHRQVLSLSLSLSIFLNTKNGNSEGKKEKKGGEGEKEEVKKVRSFSPIGFPLSMNYILY